MRGPRIAIATSQGAAPGNEAPTPSENLLMDALAGAGAMAVSAVWSDANIDWCQFSAVVIRTCWDYHLRLEEFLAWIKFLKERDIRVINHPDLIRWNSDKRYLREFAAKHIAIPETVWINPEEEADVAQICAERGWEEAVAKPIVSASAYGTERRNHGPVRGPMMIQQYLPAIETAGEWSLIYFDGQFSHAVRKRPRPSDFRVQKDHGGSVDVATPSPGLTQFADAALRELPHPATFARVDLVEQDGKVYLMEMEVIEPELFLNHVPKSAHRFASSILKALAPL
jgi:glutathione synthase/RimK-type ligase-like ATP-grasp enzyme